MATAPPPSALEENRQGFTDFRVLGPLFTHLRAGGTERDSASKRQAFYDQYATMMLLYFFNPTVASLRGL